MTETCKICSKEIGSDEVSHRHEGIIMHYECLPKYQENPAKFGGKMPWEFEEGSGKQKKRTEPKEKSKGMVLTDIDLPFDRVLWVSFQFFVAGLIIAIPIWIIFMVVIYNQ